ncbi:MAG TPA: DUF1326 domain-containing protein [Verrucomicrobiae bacterium]|nr:DUF1326 domain-containing protein [Verrucomicrobiae bacterium]
MKHRRFIVGWKVRQIVLTVLGIVALTHARVVVAADKLPFHAKGMYVEGCSCSAPCTCQLTGIEPMCQGVNAIVLTGGQYKGVELAGAKIAFATAAGKWVRLYVDARDPKQHDAAVAFARAYAKDFGKIEDVEDAKVEVAGKDGRYTLTVNDGAIMSLTTEPVLGGDGKTPLVYSNIHDTLHPTIKQGKTVGGSYNDGGHAFQLKDSNAYFQDAFNTKGNL